MKFVLVDRVVEVVPGERVVAVKAVSLAEEYLADHFPTFPVLPGVLMLEALTEAARWLVWQTEGFAHSLILLREAKNVTYKSFVAPGHTLRVEVKARRMAPDESEFVGTGYCEDKEVVKARFALSHRNLGEDNPELVEVDGRLLAEARSRWALLQCPGAEGSGGSA
jgi:3-hydroxyacyl-[acyl-carrier-protein] dehydratase